MICWVNGQWSDDDQATAVVSVNDRGLLLGDGIFETIAVQEGRPEFLDRHIRRLFDSADALRVIVPLDRDGLQSVVREICDRAALKSARLRVTLTRGLPDIPELGVPGAWDEGWRPTLAVTIGAVKPRGVTSHGGSYIVRSPRPVAPDLPSSQHKTTSYIDKLHARYFARYRGADDALLVNTRGEIAECSLSNIFWLRDGQLETPALFCGCLPGIVREVILEIGVDLDLSCREGAFRIEDLRQAEEVFATNSIIGVSPIARVDETCFKGKSPIMKRLRVEFEERAKASRHD